ncbi:Similar to Uncharacterized WD repeat-containing protein C609.03; acc. no. O94527 [Pyronema omphalodes CBS 100304]|uniref:Similar to Uncharacterized WD repeat-containing protein C609.03 acc. no. O94527 n=1 Tax=Pyronema omphalodes (strain CBS 100304) TaxID=1076935 RepID=U4LFQ0_PYROM|nr:Similar to Uncharacterized WD repeat-containing protein C609.03; acc. no. O94527 [Pyronema omphalodes CBS 100304]
MPHLNKQLFAREIDGNNGRGATSRLYSSRSWVKDLDIIGELRGHTGCINALSWSSSGSLLASGSDDTLVNIYTAYSGFHLNTRIQTGHTANIFSVKFMPFSSDGTIITAAGDTQVRVFDVEYAPTTYASLTPEATEGSIAQARRNIIHPTPGREHTRAHRVYRSHSNRAKRIITESSPHLFLTCSEDGTVRQFDLRQPSEYYTRPGAARNPNYPAQRALGRDMDDRTPPLIDYSRYGMEINSISCSLSQPHYLALGGSSPYCYLHDRRMMGRDKLAEAGRMYSREPITADDSEDRDNGATKCVRRFLPKGGDGWKSRRSHAHITSVKISDYNPNNLIASWSGDGIYAFNIHRSPLPNEPGLGREPFNLPPPRVKRDRSGGSPARKRRRERSASTSSSSPSLPDEDLVPGSHLLKLSSLITEIRQNIFTYSSSALHEQSRDPIEARKISYSAALRLAHTALKRISPAMQRFESSDLILLSRSGDEELRQVRKTLAKDRRRIRGWVKAAGCLALALGGAVEGVPADWYYRITSWNAWDGEEPRVFRMRFLNAVLAFLRGSDALMEIAREWWEEEREIAEAVDEVLAEADGDGEVDPEAAGGTAAEDGAERPGMLGPEILDRYLLSLEHQAGEGVIRDLDDSQEIFGDEKEMVRAFRGAVEMELQSSESVLRGVVERFWGERVGRALLMLYGEEPEVINWEFVERAFEEEDGDEDMAVDMDMDTAWDTDMDLDDGEIRFVDADELADDDGADEEDDDEPSEDDDDDDDDLPPDFSFFPHHSITAHRHAPVFEHTKVYRGHVNLRTVKDVNFFGPRDEYVVSGSDCGNLFIWDSHTTELLTILKGDDEVVNVATGHPVEPMLAVSGIDETVKIFSPDGLRQEKFAEWSESMGRTPGRKRWEDRERILGRNRVENQGGLGSAVFTVSFEGVRLRFAEWVEMLGGI